MLNQARRVVSGCVQQQPHHRVAPLASSLAAGAGLSQEQLQQYEQDGYLVLKNAVDVDQVKSLKTAISHVIDDVLQDLGLAEGAGSSLEAANPKLSVFRTDDKFVETDAYFLTSGDAVRGFFEPNAFEEDSSTLSRDPSAAFNKIGHALHEHVPEFAAFSNSPFVQGLVRSLGLTDAALVQSMYIFKQPRIGGAVPPHQDETFLGPNVAGLWWPIDDATLENGCLWFVPGSHRDAPYRRFVRVPGGGLDGSGVDGPATTFEGADGTPEVDAYPDEAYVAAPVAAGDVVLINGRVMHRSADNSSSKSRHAYAIHFADGTKPWPKENWLQRSDSSPFPRIGKQQ